MSLPVFYSATITDDENMHVLSEETSKHIVQVLRMQSGAEINVTNGKGYMFLAKVVNADKRGVGIQITETVFHQAPPQISIGISLVKNVQRFEWFLEKAVEIGVSEIFPILCARTEKQHLRASRLQGIITSAMLQSQQPWLPTLYEPQKFQHFIARHRDGSKFIAHCIADRQRRSLAEVADATAPFILIGPEGDFSPEEIEMALNNNYQPVSLGKNRLRTETAGIVALAILNNFKVYPQG